MITYRSQFFWKNKTWFSDFKVSSENENIVANRMKHDIRRFMAHTGLVREVVERMFKEVCMDNRPKDKWKEIYGWTMEDLGRKD